MKNVGIGVLAWAVVLVLVAGPAWAIPPLKKAFDDKYGANEVIKTASAEQKCNVCHYGNSKKNMNDYGAALKKLLKKDDYKPERLQAEADKVKAELNAALTKVEAEKSKDGEAFGDRLKVGKLPGTPVEAK